MDIGVNFLNRILLRYILILFFVFHAVFIAVNYVPIDPARSLLGPNANQQAIKALQEKLGLNKPLKDKYLSQIRLYLKGDLGRSIYYDEEIRVLFKNTTYLTFSLLISSIVFSLAAGVLFGVIIFSFDVKRHSTSKYDRLHDLLFSFASIPVFIFYVISFIVCLRWFALSPVDSKGLYYFLTIIFSSLYATVAISRFVKKSIGFHLYKTQYTAFMMALGLPYKRVIKAIVWNIAPGLIALLINLVGPIMTGVFFAEYIFGFNGFGNLIFKSVERGDVPVIVGGALVAALLLITIQILGDIFTRFFDPRVREL